MSQEAIEKAERIDKIRKDIRAKYPDFDWPEPVLEPIFFGRFDKNLIDGRKLIMDANTGVQWDVVSDRYDCVPHEVAVHNLLKACPEECGDPEIKLKMWAEGACFRAEASFPEAKMDVEIKVGDIVRPRSVIYSSYNRSTFYGVETGGDQLVCSNGLVTFASNGGAKRKHIITSSEPEAIEEVITTFLADWSKQTGQWQKWAAKKLSLDEMEEITVALPFSEKEREKMMELPLLSHDNKFLKELGKNATLWDVNSAATQMAKHEIRSERRSVELESKIAEAINKVDS